MKYVWFPTLLLCAACSTTPSAAETASPKDPGSACCEPGCCDGDPDCCAPDCCATVAGG